MSILHERYSANADTGEEMLTHAGEEGGVVVKGRIELSVGGEARILSAGDAYYFKSSIPHRFRNPGREECEIVSASSPPTF
jgi:mannose-6-phosphate isomerase-like protein (cupin superfamily)